MKLMRTLRAMVATTVTLAISSPAAFGDDTTTFTYQGRLLDAGAPADGDFDFTFKVFDAATGGEQVGPTVSALSTPVSAGLATIPVDFGAAVFTGSPRWLEVSVNGIPLTPRQQVTPTPYALSAQTLTLPFSGSVSLAHQCAFKVQNITGGAGGGGGLAICAVSDGFAAVWGDTVAPAGGGYGVLGTANVGGYGVVGTATGGTGVLGDGTGPGSVGVSGEGDDRGGWFNGGSIGVQAIGPIGVRAWGTQRSIEGIGGSEGVYGEGFTGVQGFSSAANGNGVVGSCDTGTNAWGVSGASVQGQGVVGRAGVGPLPGGGFPPATGAVGYTTSVSGTGVYGEAASPTGFNYGVQGTTASVTGIGVYGKAVHPTGVNYGVYGLTNSPNGWAGFFIGDVFTTGAYVTQSSRDLKESIQPLTGALDTIMKLQGVSYVWNSSASEIMRGKSDIGFIADEMEEVLPDIVAKDEAGKPIGIDYAKVTPITVEAIKALKAENDELRARLIKIEAILAAQGDSEK